MMEILSAVVFYEFYILFFLLFTLLFTQNKPAMYGYPFSSANIVKAHLPKNIPTLTKSANEVSQQLMQSGVQTKPRPEACEFLNQSEVLLELCKLKKCSTPKSFLQKIGMTSGVQRPANEQSFHSTNYSIMNLSNVVYKTPEKHPAPFPNKSKVGKFFKKGSKTPIAVVKAQKPEDSNEESNKLKDCIPTEKKTIIQDPSFQIPMRWDRRKRLLNLQKSNASTKPGVAGRPIVSLKNYFKVEKKIRNKFKKKLKKKEEKISLLERRLNMVTQGMKIADTELSNQEESLLSDHLRKIMTEVQLCPTTVKITNSEFQEPSTKEQLAKGTSISNSKCKCLCFCAKLEKTESNSTCPELSVLSSMMPPPPPSLMRKLHSSSSELLFNSSSNSHSCNSINS